MSIQGADFGSQQYLNGCDLYPAWVPPLPLPPFNTHCAKTQQAHCPVSLTHFYSVKDLRYTRMSELTSTTRPDNTLYLGICCMIRILVIDTTGFVERQVQRQPSGFAVWIFRVHQSIFVFVFTARVPTGGGQETTHREIPSLPTNTNAKGGLCCKRQIMLSVRGDQPPYLSHGRTHRITSSTGR